jgi:diaminohydroxyphosphoribosylaminopyrimidine deaminase / 5-amino-6-(5-phosphoribosylamino)uracil reductase
MRRALEEARKGLGRTAPNPVVGAVLVKAGKVISTGFHAKAGTPHAEVVALRQAGARARGAVLYTTLEPCDHFGRTPPCSRAILEAGIRRVVSGSADPNPLVNGKGIARLRRAGVEVVQHVLRDEADALNRPFFKLIRQRLPFVTLKVATSLDGKIATVTGDSRWVTGEAARKRVHQLRDQVDVVLVGANTIDRDDPLLTTRLPGGRNAVRLVVDSSLRLSPGKRVFQDGGPKTIVATTCPADDPKAAALSAQGVEVWTLPEKDRRVSLEALFQKLGEAGHLHVLAEGGAQLAGALLREGLVDELWVFLAPKLVGQEGLSWVGPLGLETMSQAPPLRIQSIEQVGEDLLVIATPGPSLSAQGPFR